MNKIVDTYWLADHLDDPDVIVLDSSYAAVGGQKPISIGVQIKGARRFEIDFFSDQNSPLPHMLAPVNEFEEKAQKLGINRDSHLVVYDDLGIYSSPRVWWMFRVMGHQSVSVLDGGLPKWIEEGRPVEEINASTFPTGNFKGTFLPKMVKSMEEVKDNIAKNEFQLIDARPKGRFNGSDPEPRPHLSSGHIAGSHSIPFQEVLERGSFKPTDQLKKVFQRLPSDQPLAFSCGSGLTACIVLLAADLITENEKAVYDGSWTEWASYKDNPIAAEADK